MTRPGRRRSRSDQVRADARDFTHKSRGAPYELDPKTGQERDAVLQLAAAHPGSTLFADGEFWEREYLASMQLIDIELITPTKHTVSQRPASEIAKAPIRLVIESVFSTLKRQMGLQDHLAKALPGLIARIAQRLLALTLGIYLNTILGDHHADSPLMTDDEPTSSLYV